MKILSRIFKGFDKWYLIKSYIISIAMTSFFMYVAITSNTISIFGFSLLVIMCFLFPFSTVWWDYTVQEYFKPVETTCCHCHNCHCNKSDDGGYYIAMLIFWPIKIMVFFTLTIILAPIGFTYMYFKTKPRKSNYRKRV